LPREAVGRVRSDRDLPGREHRRHGAPRGMGPADPSGTVCVAIAAMNRSPLWHRARARVRLSDLGRVFGAMLIVVAFPVNEKRIARRRNSNVESIGSRPLSLSRLLAQPGKVCHEDDRG
jgi:hypothetical protein